MLLHKAIFIDGAKVAYVRFHGTIVWLDGLRSLYKLSGMSTCNLYSDEDLYLVIKLVKNAVINKILKGVFTKASLCYLL